MYSGTTIRIKSGRVMGAHQKIDRVARRQLDKLLDESSFFPEIGRILHYEGTNGPDGIKRKSPSRDEPWHYVDPTNPNDTAIYTIIDHHIENLIQALSERDTERSAFESAWLAHAIVDALTPAHHYPLGDKIEELWGKPREERLTIKEKNIIKGKNRLDSFSKNWQYWGAKGIFTTHVMFEFGVASTIATQRFNDVMPDGNHQVRVLREGFEPIMREKVGKVFGLNMYEDFYRNGWNRRLAHITRLTLTPTIIRTVMLAWFYASEEAQKRMKAKK